MSEPSVKLGKIFIGGLSYETTDEKLRAYFGAFGPVTDAVVMKDPISRRSRGFGFITYADPVCVERALAQPNHILDSRRVEAKRAVPRAESTSRDSMSSTSSRNGSTVSTTSVASNAGSTKKLFVGGLHYETKDAEFRRYFQQYGKVVSAEVMFNRETNKSRGFGFVIFEHEKSVELVLQDNNHVIDGKSVEVKRAVPRTDIPPSRSVSSRAGSFCGPGPGSVGSLDDVSVTSTASVSRAGTPSSSLSASAASLNERYSGTSASGTLSGYAAAVRYGGRGIPRSSSTHDTSTLSDLSKLDNPERTLARVADRLTSLVLEDDVTAPLSSVSSRGSDKLLSPVPSLVSPLPVSSRPMGDSLGDQWSLSPSIAPQTSSEIPHLTSSQVENTWQTRPWQAGWASQAEREERAAREVSQERMRPPSYFSPFAHSHTSRNPSNTWSASSYASPSSDFGARGMGMGTNAPLTVEGLGSRGNLFDGSSNGAFGTSRLGMGPRSPYGGGLGGFLQPPEYLPQTEPELPLDSTFGSVIGDLNDEKIDDPVHFDHQYA